MRRGMREGGRMRALLCAMAIAAAGPALHADPEPPPRCEVCGRVLGEEVPETRLSRDPDFRAAGMFQRCATCIEKAMDRTALVRFEEIVSKYKWNSVSHNRRLSQRGARRPNPRRGAPSAPD